MTAVYTENKKEKEKVKVDSFGLQSSESIQNTSSNILVKENKNEIAGEIMITGKSDSSNPFVFHNVIGRDTIQSISIRGNAEYLISNHYTKTDRKKSEVRKEEFTGIIQDLTQSSVSKEKIKETDSEVSSETVKVSAHGFQAGTWIVITIVVTFLIFIFFTYKYFKE